MRRKNQIYFSGYDADVYKIVKKYKGLSLDRCIDNGHFAYLYFYEDSEEYVRLKKDLAKRNLDVSEQYKMEYTDEELKKIPYHQMVLHNPWEKKSYYAYSCGSEYEGGCDCCKYGKVLKGDLYAPSRIALIYDICQLKPEVIVKDSLIQEFERENITGFQYGAVRDFRSKDVVPELHVLKFDHTLPPMSDEMWVDREVCSLCKSEYVSLNCYPIYSLKDFEGAKDFNMTAEHHSRELGSNMPVYMQDGKYSMNYSYPFIIVSTKVKELVMKHCKKESYLFHPVTFTDLQL